MKRKDIFFTIKYPKLVLLILTFVLAYALFYGKTYPPVHNFILSMSYVGTFITGMFFVYGFTAAPATSIFLILAQEQNIFLAGIIGGFGALCGDLILFRSIRRSYAFANEIKSISHEKLYVYLSGKINGNVPSLMKKYLAVVFAGFLIASPLPDEIGVSLLAFSTKLSTKMFSILAYSLNTVGIFVILLIGKML